MPRKKNQNHQICFLLTPCITLMEENQNHQICLLLTPCITLMEEKSKSPNLLFTLNTLHHPDGRKIKTT